MTELLFTGEQLGRLALQFLLAGAGTLSFAILFACPRRTLPYCGLVGAVGWLVYEIAELFGMEAFAASLLAVIPLTLLARILAMTLRAPVTVFLLTGIFPLVPGAGIGEVDAIEKYHGLVERAPTDEDVGLHALAPAFADIDRRCEAQGGLQSLDGRCGLCFPVEKRGLRLYVARRGGLAARNADLVDPQRFEDGGRIGIVRRRMLRREQEDRHRHGEDSDGYMAVQARKGCPALAAPTPEAGSLLGSDVFHLEFVGLIIKKNRSSR